MDDNNLERILIRSGTIVDPEKGNEYIADILIENGLIAAIEKEIKIDKLIKEAPLTLDAHNLKVTPGFIDMHVHLRDPGYEFKETIETGSLAAARGGVTTMACMPNTKPSIDSEYLISYVLNKAADLPCKILPVAAMTKQLEGREITEMGLLGEAGAIGFSDDGKSVEDAKLMFEIMRYSIQFGLPLILHEENSFFSAGGLMHEGRYSTILGLEGISCLSDDLMISRDIMLAKRSGARIHITHLSTEEGVKMVRKAKEGGINITCDVTPHHLFYNDSNLKTFNTNLKVKPPIRGFNDQRALIEGIKEGTIDAIASDHAPHLDTEKNTTFKSAAFGTIGLETLFSASYTKLVVEEKMPLPKVVKLLTSSPADILNINAGRMIRGSEADLVIIDTEKSRTYKKEDIVSKSKNSAFIGQKLCGEVIYTIKKGKIVYGGK